MKVLATALIFLIGPAAGLVDGRNEVETLRDRCNEQERQISALETQIESLHSQLALERRRARGASVAEVVQPAAPAAAKGSYTVGNGDTLSSIARRYHTTAEALMKANGIKDPTRLLVGQKLVLPAAALPSASVPKPAPPRLADKAAPKAAKPAAAPKPAPKADDHYKVRRGDTFFSVARKHKMTIASLKALNPGVDSDKIVVGQSLGVSGKARNSPAPTLGSGGTRTIATKAPAPKKAPAAKPVADTAKAPKATPVREAAPKPEPTPPTTVSSVIVMEEITFGDFAKKHGTTTERLNALNGHNLRGDITLAKGSEFYVPGR